MQTPLFDFGPPRLSVTEVNAHIRQLIDADEILQDLWLEGEISNWRPASSGHIYFTLKDAAASIRCVVWRSTASRLRYRPKGDGEAVALYGRVSVYEAGGAYQFYVNDIEPLGVGALYVQFERLKQQLAAEGLFDEDHKRPLPPFPHRIGVVTSPKAAALRDILNVLSRRFPLAEVTLSPAAVQGTDAPPQIVAALKRLWVQSPPPDVIIVARGGGSIEDLWAFNDESVARAVFNSPIPVITGVGHETDFTIVDFVADRRAPTPSAAAEVATPDRQELKSYVAGYAFQMENTISQQITEKRAAVQQSVQQLARLSPQMQIDTRRQQIDDTLTDIARALKHTISLRREQLSGQLAQLATLNPKATLARGYAIVQKGETVVASVKDVSPGDTVSIVVSDGDFTAEVRES